MSTQVQEMMEVSFDELLKDETNHSANVKTCTDHTGDAKEEDIDYFGDYNPTANDHDNDIDDPSLINDSYDLALNEYINNHQPFYKSPYSHSYRKRYRRISDMAMEERDEWEQMAKRNKRRRLNQHSLNNAHTTQQTHIINDNLDNEEDESSSSSSASFEAILFENNNSIVNNDTSDTSSDDDDCIAHKQQKEAAKRNQIKNLIRIPKKQSSSTRSHLDLIKAARKAYEMKKELPILEDFTQQQNITKKRAKRAILQVMRENNLDLTMLRRRRKKMKDEKSSRKLQRYKDESESDGAFSDNSSGVDMDSNDDKQLKLLNLAPDAGKYPFDSAVEKAMLRLLNRFKKFNNLFVQRRSNEISIDLSIMIDKVSSMKAYANIGIDFRFDFERLAESFQQFYGTNPAIVDLCAKFLQFGKILIEKSDAKLVQRAKDKPMAWHLKQMMKQKRINHKRHKHKKQLHSDPVDIEGFWKIPYKKIKYRGDQSKLEKLERFTFENPFKYEAIFEYIPCVQPEHEQVLTMKKLETNKVNQCEGKHCDDLSKLGPYDVGSMQFKTECLDRKDCMECGDKCGCAANAKLCRNRCIQNGDRKIMGKHLREQLTFGIDQSTRRRIAKTCIKECGFGATEISKFIQDVLQPSFNSFMLDCQQYPHLKSGKIIYKKCSLNGRTAPFFMTDVLKMILSKHKDVNYDSFAIKQEDAEMSSCLLSKISKLAAKRMNIDNSAHNVLDIGGDLEGSFCEEFYPIYPKGNGVICVDRQGIDINSFIIEYFGEVYPAWRWYEKCDLQKQVSRALSDVSELPDFFNIMLERHDNDPDGYDLLFIDPIKKGNFGSRFSHSCSPNTQTVAMIDSANKKYVIGIYSNNKIKYGQELTFDYNSVTESEQEYRSAICLCSQYKCRGTYLSYAGSTNYLQILSTYHNNLHRQAIIFKACCFNQNSENKEEMMKKLSERHIGKCVLSDLPFWGVQFAYLISNFIEFEARELPKELNRKYCSKNYRNITSDDIQNEVYGVKQQRIQNVVITLDKIKYVLRNQSTQNKQKQAPIRRLSSVEILNKIWNDENSLIHSLIKCLKFHKNSANNQKNNKLHIEEIENLYISNLNLKTDLSDLKKKLFFIRDKLRKCLSSETCYFSAAADLLHLWANSKYFFVHNNYDSIKSLPFTLRELGFEESKKININMSCQKPYGPLYIWGQLSFWWKQTVEKPDTSLAHCRRGCIYLPFLDSCFSKKINKAIIKPYDNQTRNYFIQSLAENCHSSWSNSLHFSFKSITPQTQKIYASPFLDHYLDYDHDDDHNNQNNANQLIQIIKQLKEWQY